MDLGTVISAVLGVLTLVSVVASAVAVARATLAKTTIDTLTQNNTALSERVDILQAENDRRKIESAEQAIKLTALKVENEALQNYVSGTDAVKELAQLVTRADQARASEHHDILAAIQTVPMIVTSHHEEIMALIKASVHTHEKP